MSRRKRNSSKINLTISVIFHSVLLVAIVFLAAREGMLGKKMKELTVITQPKEEKKQPEQAKQKPVEPPKEAPKQVETAKVAAAPPPVAQSAAPPPDGALPTAAPAAVNLPDMDFDTGAKATLSVSDPKVIYKGLVELAFRSHWVRPDDLDDTTFVADVEVSIDNQGRIGGSRFVKLAGNPRWDNSVKAAVAATKALSRPPPKGFPPTILVRFDIQTEGDSLMQVSSR